MIDQAKSDEMAPPREVRVGGSYKFCRVSTRMPSLEPAGLWRICVVRKMPVMDFL